MVHQKNSFKSADGIHDISYEVILPDGDAKGIVQISHGMCEYFGRYNDFGKYMASHGYIVCGNDHLGTVKVSEVTTSSAIFHRKTAGKMLFQTCSH